LREEDPKFLIQFYKLQSSSNTSEHVTMNKV